jgi:hypothetical protein
VAVLAAADLAADGHRAGLGGALDPREIRPLFGTETALEPGRAALAGAATGGASGVTEGKLAVDIGLGLAGAIIRARSRMLGSSTVLTFVVTTTANLVPQALQIISTSARARLSSGYTEATKA